MRHYEKIGLLPEAERSEPGYRLYSANDLLHLNRVKKLRSLGLTLRQVRSVLGGGDSELSLRTALEALRTQVRAEMAHLEERRRRIAGALSELKETVREVSRRCAVVVIAHRLSTAVDADKIVLLEDGTVSAEGTYEELLGASPLYKRLVETQMIEAERLL